jgi:hypothetical protein
VRSNIVHELWRLEEVRTRRRSLRSL